jgi:hypothetical protein
LKSAIDEQTHRLGPWPTLAPQRRCNGGCTVDPTPTITCIIFTATWTWARGVTQTQRLGVGHVGLHRHSNLESGTWGYTYTATWSRARRVTQTQQLGVGHVGYTDTATWSRARGVTQTQRLGVVRRGVYASRLGVVRRGVYASRLGVCM